MTAACVFDALPALASTIVGWLLEYPIIYCLLSPREVAEWGALLFEPEEYAAATSIASDMDAPFRLGMDLAHCSQWWSRCGGPRVAALVAQTLARGDNRRHALTSTSAWLFEVYAKASGGTEHGLVERDERGVFMATSANKNAEEHGRAEDCDDDDDDDAFANSMLRSRKKAATKIPKPSKSGRSLPSASDAADPEFCFCFSLPSALCVAACHCIVGADGDNTSNEDEALARLLARYRASLSASASAHASALCISVRASQTLLEHVAL